MQNLSSIKTDKNQDRNSDRSGYDKNSEREEKGNFAENVKDKFDSAKDKFQDVASSAAESVKNVGESIPQVIRRYPLQSLAIGFGVGLLSAALIGRRASSN